MITNLPKGKIRSSLKSRLDVAGVPKMNAMVWLNYQLFLRRLARLAAEKAKADKSAVIREHHVKAASKEILGKSRG